jgi:hypothetical protein
MNRQNSAFPDLELEGIRHWLTSLLNSVTSSSRWKATHVCPEVCLFSVASIRPRPSSAGMKVLSSVITAAHAMASRIMAEIKYRLWSRVAASIMFRRVGVMCKENIVDFVSDLYRRRSFRCLKREACGGSWKRLSLKHDIRAVDHLINGGNRTLTRLVTSFSYIA